MTLSRKGQGHYSVEVIKVYKPTVGKNLSFYNLLLLVGHGNQRAHIAKFYGRLQLIHIVIFTMVSYFLRWTLLKIFSSIPDEQSQQKVRRLDRITCAVINTSNEVKCLLLWEFWINNFSRRILERDLVGNIVNIRNECLFFWVHGVWIVARNKQITREPLRGSRDLFVPRYDSYPMNPEKKTLIP